MTEPHPAEGGRPDVAAAARMLLGGHVWAMRPDVLAALVDVARNGQLEPFAQAADQAGPEAARRSRRRTETVGGGVAVIPLQGVITPHGMGLLGLLLGLGGGGLDMFRSDLRSALADHDVGSIVLNIDSPGGLVDLVPEVSAEVRAAREQKPIVAVANTMAASAAYMIGSQAGEFVVTPSGEVGSIGVYATHRDISGLEQQMGVKTTLISAGKYKTEGNPYEPLGDDARDAIQQAVNDYYAQFIAAVAAGRVVKAAEVRSGYGEGRTLTAKRALDAGLADRVETLEETVARLARGRGRTGRAAEAPSAGAERQDAGAEAEAGAAEDITYSPDERQRVLDVLAR